MEQTYCTLTTGVMTPKPLDCAGADAISAAVSVVVSFISSVLGSATNTCVFAYMQVSGCNEGEYRS